MTIVVLAELTLVRQGAVEVNWCSAYIGAFMSWVTGTPNGIEGLKGSFRTVTRVNKDSDSEYSSWRDPGGQKLK